MSTSVAEGRLVVKTIKRLLVLAVLGLGGLVAVNPEQWGPLEPLKQKLAELGALPNRSAFPGTTTFTTTPARVGESIRIASFNIQVFGPPKLDRPEVAEVLARIIRMFDVVAIQEIRSEQQDLMLRFVRLINADGQAAYDYVLGPRLGRSNSKEQYAYVYNTATLELDRSSVYTVEDRDDLLHREPLVAGFRARGAAENEAFTFTLINIHTDPDEVKREVSVLDDAFRAVRDDGRQEDDIILLGDLNAAPRQFGDVAKIPYVQWVIDDVPTNTRRTETYDNLLFDRRATSEFLGRAGVVDLVREFNLSQAAALEISDHLPIWAEFTVREGGIPGANLAERSETSVAR